jgi:hypothetical protein
VSKYPFRAYRKDGNHADIVRMLAQLGIEAWDMSCYGFPVDLYIVKNSQSAWIEIKDGTKRPSKRKLTDRCGEFSEFLERNGARLYTVKSEDEAIAMARMLTAGVKQHLNGFH